VQIRRTQAADLDVLVAIENTVFPSDRMSRRSLQRSISSPTMTMLTAVSEGTPVGYALVHRRRGSKIAHLASIAVGRDTASGANSCGVLRQTRLATCVRLEVRSDNSVARHLYGFAGYQITATLDDYYEDGTSAVRYEKVLARRSGARASKPERPHLTR